MRRALYQSSAIPPRAWLIWAALIWERVQLSNGLPDTLRKFPEYTASDPDANLLLQLTAETDVCAYDSPGTDEARLSSEEQLDWSAHCRQTTAALEEFIANEPEEVSKGKRYSVTAEQMLSLHTVMGKVLFPPQFRAAFPHVDLFCEDRSSVVTSDLSKSALVMTAVEAVVPVAPSSISMSQLQSFRAATALHRSRFSDLIASELRDFDDIATEGAFKSK